MRIKFDKRWVRVDLRETVSQVAKLQEKHSLVKDNRVHPTDELLRDVCRHLSKIGIENATLTNAWQFWRAIDAEFTRLAEAYQTYAEIAYWYKIQPWRLNDQQKCGLLANLPRVQAQEKLHQGSMQPHQYQEIYQLVLAATGDKELAKSIRLKAMEAHVDSEMSRRQTVSGR